MESREIRIGSILKWKDNGVGICCDMGFIMSTAFWAHISNGDIVGVPLTNGWFEENGVKDPDEYYYVQHPKNSYLRFYLTDGYIQLVNGSCTPISNYRHITTVHKFQNLFSDITDSELKIS